MNKQECLQLLKKFEGTSFIKYCGIKLLDADCGWVKSCMEVKDVITNPFGFIHGGAIATLIDTTGGIVCWTVGCTVCTLDLQTNFMKNVKVGHTIFAEASILRKTKHVIFVEIKVYSDEYEILSKGQVTMYITGTYDKIPPKW
jgi:acyl-CoA thioesterase